MTTKVSLIANNAVISSYIKDKNITADDIANNIIPKDKINFAEELVEVGTIVLWSGTTPPPGYLFCDGISNIPTNSSLRSTIAKTPNLQIAGYSYKFIIKVL